MQSLLFFIIALFSFVTSAYSQQVVTGVAYDNAGNFLSQAEVVLFNQENKYQTHTDENGVYLLEGVNKGTYKILLVSDGKKSGYNIEVRDQEVYYDLILEGHDRGNRMKDLIINVQSVKNRKEREGFAVNVIETKEAALRNIQTNELLDQSVGVRVRQNGGLGSGVNYNLNGMSGNSVRVFINGIPASTFGSSFDLNSIPPALIERIEVYKGVIPSYLADDALGGAINVVLKKNMNNNINASISYGSFNTFQANFSAAYRDDKSGFTIKPSAFYNFSDNNYEVWGKFARNILADGSYEYVRAKRFNDAYKSKGGRVELGFTDVKWADQMMVGINLSDSYKEIQHGTYMTVPYYGRFTEADARVLSLEYQKKNIVKNLDLSLSGMLSSRTTTVNDTVKWRYNWYGQIATGLYGEPLLTPQGAQQGAPTLNTIKRDVSTLRSLLTYHIHNQHRIVFSHYYYGVNRNDTDKLKSIAQQQFEGTRYVTKNISSLSYEFDAFQKKLRGNIFYKYYLQNLRKTDPVAVKDENNNTIRELQTKEQKQKTSGYGIATAYALSENTSLLFSAEKAVRLPSENEIFGSPGENILENNDIRPEISNNFNLGAKIGPFKIQEHHRLSFSVSGFLRDTKDKIVRRVNDRINNAEQTAPFENLGKTQSIGFEFEMHYNIKRKLNIGASMSKFKTVFNDRYDVNGNEYRHRYKVQIPNEPFFTANANAQYTFEDVLLEKTKLHLHYNFSFIQSFYTIWPLETTANYHSYLAESQVPKQFIQDIGMSYVFPKKNFVLSFDVKNIFDKQAYDNFAVQKPGRAFYLKLNYNFNNL